VIIEGDELCVRRGGKQQRPNQGGQRQPRMNKELRFHSILSSGNWGQAGTVGRMGSRMVELIIIPNGLAGKRESSKNHR
jgi:hypothetical protein